MTQTNGFFTTSDQAHLYYEVHGKGQPLFLVHGWQCSSRFWQHNIPELSKHFQVIVMDNRGHGKPPKVCRAKSLPVTHRISANFLNSGSEKFYPHGLVFRRTYSAFLLAAI